MGTRLQSSAQAYYRTQLGLILRFEIEFLRSIKYVLWKQSQLPQDVFYSRLPDSRTTTFDGEMLGSRICSLQPSQTYMQGPNSEGLELIIRLHVYANDTCCLIINSNTSLLAYYIVVHTHYYRQALHGKPHSSCCHSWMAGS